MAFSSFSEFLSIASIDSWRLLRSGNLSFGNRKKSQGVKSGDYGGWAMTFVSCLAKNSIQTIKLKINPSGPVWENGHRVLWPFSDTGPLGKVLPYESGGDALHTQNMDHNVLSRSIRDDDLSTIQCPNRIRGRDAWTRQYTFPISIKCRNGLKFEIKNIWLLFASRCIFFFFGIFLFDK